MKSTNTKEVSYIASFWGSSYYNKPRFFKEKMKGLTKTAILLSEELFDYFSTESGRKKTHKIWNNSEIKSLIGTSRSSITRAIEEIKELDIFLIHSEGENKYKEYGFYVKTIENLALFERVKQDKAFLQLKKRKYFEEIPNNILNYSDSKMIDNCSKMDIYQSEMNAYRSKMSDTNSKMDTCEVPQTIVNTEINESPKNLQESYIKESISKETYINIEKKNISNDSTLEKKETIASEEKNVMNAFLKIDENIKEKENIKSDIELDEIEKVKEILIYDYGFSDAEKIVKDFSIKCIRECIDTLINEIDNGKEVNNEGSYLRSKIKYWKEKKESVQETSRPAISSKNISVPGESDFINLIYSKKLVHISQKNLNDCVQALITCAKKDLFLEIKEKFSREQIGQFINAYQNTFTFAYKYTNDVARFWQFFNDINELDKYTEELRIKNEKSRLEILEKFKNSMKKDDSKDTLIQKIDTFSNLNDLIQEDDNENIPY